MSSNRRRKLRADRAVANAGKRGEHRDRQWNESISQKLQMPDSSLANESLAGRSLRHHRVASDNPPSLTNQKKKPSYPREENCCLQGWPRRLPQAASKDIEQTTKQMANAPQCAGRLPLSGWGMLVPSSNTSGSGK